MFLKKVIINGFKSFADKVVLQFDKTHITGIVGPNGSGKSNVIDAVRWVMGEQNPKMLRGEVATDIIFSGSEKRKALAMAEVSLVFDNSVASNYCPPQYRSDEEISLTRRLYSDGEREFFINQKPCRLKDIISFFASSGMGSKSYSMIQQGQVDRILQAKPEELREIIEEASGVNIFKKHKQETKAKLTQTEENLSRVKDIQHEIETQMKALSEQVENAKKWQDYQNGLRENEILLLEQNALFFSEKKQELSKDLLNLKSSEASTLSQIAQKESDYTNLLTKFEETNPEISHMMEIIASVREKIAVCESSLINLKPLLENGQGDLEILSKEVYDEELALRKLEEEEETASKNLKYLESNLEILEDDLARIEDEMEGFQEQFIVLENRNHTISKDLKDTKERWENQKYEQEALIKDLESHRLERDEYTAKKHEYESMISKSMILLDSCKLKLSNIERSLELIQNEKIKLESKIKEKELEASREKELLDSEQSKVMEKKALLKVLGQQKPKGNGSQSLAQKAENHGLASKVWRIADHIKFNQVGKELSSELKANIDHWSDCLWVKDLETLEKIVIFAEESDLADVRVHLDSPSSIVATSLHGPTILDYVELAPEAKCLETFLKHVITLNEEKTPSKKTLDALGENFILITKSSIVHSKSQLLITGGELYGDLHTKEEIETLEADIEVLDDHISHIESRIEKILYQKQVLSAQLEDAEYKEKSYDKERLEALTTFQSIQNELSYRQDLILGLDKKHKVMIERFEKSERALKKLQEEREILKEKRRKLTLESETIEADLAEMEDLKAEKDDIKQEKRIQVASYQAEFSVLRQNATRYEEQLKSADSRFRKKQFDFEKRQNEFLTAKDRKESLETEFKALLHERELTEKVLEEKKGAYSEITKNMKEFEKELKTLRQAQETILIQKMDKQNDLEKINATVESLLAQYLELFTKPLVLETIEFVESFNVKKVTGLIASLKQKIANLGPVNMLAVKEFDDLVERHQFIDQQQTEILDSIETLNKAIFEIEETSRKRFMAAFDTLNHEFHYLFPVLFPRGEAKLELTNPADPLESGVEIFVRLPGKSRQNMRLFSGGEKALTAIALIFALLKSKPTPYCFLDEVDAALDESNIAKYNRVLNTLSDKFQFIVITHRRKTIEVLDTLYGVTMQEPGVSKIVGVDLNKELPPHLQKMVAQLELATQENKEGVH